MRSGSLLALVLAALPAVVSTAAAAPPHAGSRDLSFGDRGRVVLKLPAEQMVPQAMAVQPDGKVVVAGTLPGSSGVYPDPYFGSAAAARLLPDGHLDPSFGSGGVARAGFDLPVAIDGLAIQPDGALLLSGTAWTDDGRPRGAVAKLLPSGEADETFGARGLATFSSDGGAGYAYAVRSMSRLAVQPDGRIVVAGTQNETDPHRFALPLVARLLPSGELDPTFYGDGTAPIGPDIPTAVVVRPDGDAVVVGVNEEYGGGTGLIALRVSAGPTDPQPTSSPWVYHEYRHSVTGLTAQAAPDGSVLFAGGMATGPVRKDLAVARFGEDLELLERRRVQVPAVVGVEGATIDRRGSILTAGPGVPAANSRVYRVERFLHTSRLDGSFGNTNGRAVIRIEEPAELIGMAMSGNKVIVAGATRSKGPSASGPATIYRLHARQDDTGPRITLRGLPRRGCLERTTTLRVRIRDESRTRTRVRIAKHSLANTTRTRFTLPLEPSGVKPGRHHLSVRAIDAAGNLGAVGRTIRVCR